MSESPPNIIPDHDLEGTERDEAKSPRTLWHPAVVRAIEFELEDCRDDLAIEAEYQLTTEPLRIDVLIIKKKRDVILKKNIARIFRQCNIIEYKSPDDHVTVEDYDKTHAYARLYASLNKVRTHDLSVTMTTTRHPRKLLAFLKDQFKVRQEQQGIYLVEGEVYPTQIIVVKELSDKENLWLASLRKDLTLKQITQAFSASVGKPNIEPFLYAIANANPKVLEEFYMQQKQQNVILTEKLDTYFTNKYAAPWIAKGEAKGKAEGRNEEKTEIARNMKNRGCDPDFISEVTGLSTDEIERLG